MAKISKVFYWVLVLTVLLLGACKKSSKGRSINGGDQGLPYPNGADYTIEMLSDEEFENVPGGLERQAGYLQDDPSFEGPIRVEEITDSTVKLYFDPALKENVPDGLKDKDLLYFVYLRNPETGKYQTKLYLDVEPDYPFKEYHVVLYGLRADTMQSIYIALETTGYAYDNRRVIRFRTKDTPNPPHMIAVGKSWGLYPSMIGTNRTPKLYASFPISGVQKAKFFSDSACTQEIGETDIGASSYHFSLTLATPLPVGEHHFYAKFINSLGNSSACSTAYATYTVVECPEDYVVVQPEEDLGTPAFCIMRMEARRGANDVAVPGYEEYPWEATPQEAKDACRRVGPNCDIITNLEWMAAAWQIERSLGNWHIEGGEVRAGNVSNNYGVLNITSPIVQDSYRSYYRTFDLPDGTIYDFGGNLAEWADNAEVGGEVFQPITNTCPQGPFELYDHGFNCPALDARYYTPLNRSGLERRSEISFMGVIVGPLPADRNSATPLAAARGGQANDMNHKGIYSLFMFNHMTDTNGFRCVCHLPEE